mmetsp:Transcript_183/g.158  ORF Transcript_183/g.158 Transcript_183/m.158 type:complete len:229 (-) Transcript_183:212-898(-)
MFVIPAIFANKSNQNIQCVSCQKPVKTNAKFCSNCGTKVQLTTKIKCNHCNIELDSNSKFCHGCGKQVSKSNNYNGNNTSTHSYNKNNDTSNHDKKAKQMSKRPSIDITRIDTYRIKSGLNYVGVCGNHIAVCNKGFDDDIRPSEDYEDGDIKCDECEKEFEYETMVLTNCKCEIKYKLFGGQNQKLSVSQNINNKRLYDVCKEVFKYKSVNYLVLNVQQRRNMNRTR